MRPGDVVIGLLPGATETKVRPAVVIASATYLVERPDVSGLGAASCFRAYMLTIHCANLMVIGHLSEQDWEQVKARVRTAFDTSGNF